MNTSGYSVGKFIANLHVKVLNHCPFRLCDSFELANLVNSQKIPNGYFVSFDVCNLFTCILRKEAVEMAITALSNQGFNIEQLHLLFDIALGALILF